MSSSFKNWVTKFNIEPQGILHAGAHLVQERDLYRDLEMEPVLWIEAHPSIAIEAAKLLETYSNQKLINAALWSVSNHNLFLSEAGNEGSSSSLLELGLITGSHPQVVSTKRIEVKSKTLKEVLDSEKEISRDISFLCIDTQGAEAEVIKGLGSGIVQFNFVLAEVSIRRLYKGAVLFKELSNKLAKEGFLLVASNINKTTGWGDALYIRDSEVLRLGIQQSDYEHILIKEGTAIATKLRYALLRLGIPNRFVAKLTRSD